MATLFAVKIALSTTVFRKISLIIKADLAIFWISISVAFIFDQAIFPESQELVKKRKSTDFGARVS